MEEKWDVYSYDSRLILCRSWTSQIEIVAETIEEAGGFTVTAVHTRVSSDQPEIVVRDVDFLVKTYIAGHEVPHSIPAFIPSSERAILTYSFSRFGRAAAFATYEDTTNFVI
jgi:hypothetical protein